MLVLTRFKGTRVVLDFSQMSDAELAALRREPVLVTPVDIRGDKVRLGFDGPKSLQVHRAEYHAALVTEGVLPVAAPVPAGKRGAA